MERAPHNAHVLPPGTEVSREEKVNIARPEAGEEALGVPTAGDRCLSLNQLINKLNHINFQNGTISVVFKHYKYQHILTLEACPLPCQDERFACNWAEPADVDQLIEFYRFDRLLISKGQQRIEVKPELKGFGEKQISFVLPEVCREISERKHHRFQCTDTEAFVFQNSALFYGRLIDYGVFQLRISVRTTPPQTFFWLDSEETVTLVLTKENKTLFSGECRIIKQDKGQQVRQLIVEPVKRKVHRFSPREFRSTRQKLSPSMDAVFKHPLFDKTFTLKVADISGSGFAVEEEERLAVLLPGLIIPKLELVFSDGLSVCCMAQVVYSKKQRELRSENILKCGLAILDMAVEDHKKLLALLHQASDTNTYVCNRVDMDNLWDFFFETGFIYPKKYEFLQANKETIKTTYEKLYQSNHSIASHFIYQDNGRILAHMAMVRFYERSWLIHHHAAVRSTYNRGGLMVLNQVGRFINDAHRLYSMKMDYVFCYYRPENKFPSHVFGGAARNIQNPQICSIDLFAYFHCRLNADEKIMLPENWRLETVTKNDLYALQTAYNNESGGLMLQALHLTPETMDSSDLSDVYKKIGLKRSRHTFALRHRERLCAVLMANAADFGLNMSDLTNSVHLIAANVKHLTAEVVQAAVKNLADIFQIPEVPVLMYPKYTADSIGLDYEKSYYLWAYHTQNTDPYFRFLKRLLKFIQH